MLLIIINGFCGLKLYQVYQSVIFIDKASKIRQKVAYHHILRPLTWYSSLREINQVTA